MMESIKNRVLKRASGLGLEVSDRHPRIARPDVFPPLARRTSKRIVLVMQGGPRESSAARLRSCAASCFARCATGTSIPLELPAIGNTFGFNTGTLAADSYSFDFLFAASTLPN